MARRDLHLALFGATGFTGALVAEYLARAPELRDRPWALVGRDRGKLEGVRERLLAGLPSTARLELLVADARDSTALRRVAERSSVVASTAGPYARLGGELVAACVEAGTDYCDITGEVPWIRRMIDRHHEPAVAKGVRVVHCCGYDSIPSELGTWMVQEKARELFGAGCSEVNHWAAEARGAFSGGTVASLFGIVEEARRDPEVRRLLQDPYGLDPAGSPRGTDGPDQTGVRWSDDLERWTAPFLMAPINTRIVRRGHALLGHPWGVDFRYAEAMAFPAGARGAVMASVVAAGLGALPMLAALPPTRALLRRLLPAPGEGPDAETRARGFFRSHFLGKGRTDVGRPFRVRGLVEGQSDPGYGETAKMLAESALSLSFDEPSGLRGGVLTPVSALGPALLRRLRAAGMTFDARAD